MRILGAFVVTGLLFVTSLHGQTVRSHSSLRIPTPAIDASEEASSSSIRPASASRLRAVPAREASMRQETESYGSSATDASRPMLVPLDDATVVNTQDAPLGRTVSSTTTLMPINSAPVGSGVQYYGPTVDSSSNLRPAASSDGYATQASYGAPMSPTVTYAQPTVTYAQPTVVPSTYPPASSSPTFSVPNSGVVRTSFSQPVIVTPANGACCGGAPTNTVVTGMQPTFPGTTFPATTFPTTAFSPPIADAASFAPTLNGSTIPGAGFPAQAPSGALVPFVVNPLAVNNIPAVPVDESRLQPILALRPTVPEASYAGRGILGQPELYVEGQHARNFLRYITLW